MSEKSSACVTAEHKLHDHFHNFFIYMLYHLYLSLSYHWFHLFPRIPAAGFPVLAREHRVPLPNARLSRPEGSKDSRKSRKRSFAGSGGGRKNIKWETRVQLRIRIGSHEKAVQVFEEEDEVLFPVSAPSNLFPSSLVFCYIETETCASYFQWLGLWSYYILLLKLFEFGVSV